MELIMADTLEVDIDPKLLAEARSLGIDISREIALHLRNRIEKRKREIAWQDENREAIEAWNAEIEQNGLWYEHIRTK
jgi:post-segregation antitoxin (ccd killing protein)